MDNDITTPRFPHYAENVPDELKAGERWVCCDEYKVPLIAIENGAVFAASSTNPETWRYYDTAVATWQQNEHIAGIGRIIAEDEDYVGIDLDDCIDPETGELTPWAATIIDQLDSYSEISPSLTGVKIWVKAPEIKTAYIRSRASRSIRHAAISPLPGSPSAARSRRSLFATTSSPTSSRRSSRRSTEIGRRTTGRLASWISTSSSSGRTLRSSRSPPTARPNASTGFGARGSASTPMATRVAPTAASTKTEPCSSAAGTLTVRDVRGGSFATTSKRCCSSAARRARSGGGYDELHQLRV